MSHHCPTDTMLHSVANPYKAQENEETYGYSRDFRGELRVFDAG